MSMRTWEPATVTAIHDETATAKTFRLRLPHPSEHLAGQHYIVRLRAPDGYTAMRSYSVASAPDGTPEFDLTVERLPDGEVSTFLHDEAIVGDELEVRGPIGGWFVWKADHPALLVGGGSGVVPLMAMLRLSRRLGVSDLLRLVVSVRTPADLYYADELPGPETLIVYSARRQPDTAGQPNDSTRTTSDHRSRWMRLFTSAARRRLPTRRRTQCSGWALLSGGSVSSASGQRASHTGHFGSRAWTDQRGHKPTGGG